jgi:hypothetical protein
VSPVTEKEAEVPLNVTELVPLLNPLPAIVTAVLSTPWVGLKLVIAGTGPDEPSLNVAMAPVHVTAALPGVTAEARVAARSPVDPRHPMAKTMAPKARTGRLTRSWRKSAGDVGGRVQTARCVRRRRRLSIADHA